MSANDELKRVLENVNSLCGHSHPSVENQPGQEQESKDLSSLSIDEIIKILSGIHKGESIDPETLAGDSFHQFNRHHDRFEDIFSLQPLLFSKCRERGDAWTK
ncbi:hypothetical protein HGA34_00980 [Candidatus Falkowbacteria bacterium]|nr:hypothetical protein [Candidatus Falkowbacteria bacterium]